MEVAGLEIIMLLKKLFLTCRFLNSKIGSLRNIIIKIAKKTS